MQRAFQILIVLALACAAQLHLPALKLVAWGGMLVSYSREAPLRDAVEMTFDGEHPCALCCEIQKQVEQAPQHELCAPSVPEQRACVARGDGAPVPLQPAAMRSIPAATVPPSRTDEPELQPPRGLT